MSTVQKAASEHQLLLHGLFLCSNLFPARGRKGPGGTDAPQWRGVLLIARYFWPENYLPFWILSKIQDTARNCARDSRVDPFAVSVDCSQG